MSHAKVLIAGDGSLDMRSARVEGVEVASSSEVSVVGAGSVRISIEQSAGVSGVDGSLILKVASGILFLHGGSVPTSRVKVDCGGFI